MASMATPEQTQTQTCYRHPGRETAVSCSNCGRPICPDCMVYAAVGIKCPECAGQPTGARAATRRVGRVAGTGTGALVTKTLIGINVVVYLISIAQGSGGLTPGAVVHQPLGAQRLRRRRRRVVAPDHGRVPAREPDPPRLQHAHALVVRPGARVGDRPRPLPRRLSRLRARGLGRRAPAERRVRQHRRRLRARSSGSSARASCSSGARSTSSAAARSSSSSSTSPSPSRSPTSPSAATSAGSSAASSPCSRSPSPAGTRSTAAST